MAGVPQSPALRLVVWVGDCATLGVPPRHSTYLSPNRLGQASQLDDRQWQSRSTRARVAQTRERERDPCEPSFSIFTADVHPLRAFVLFSVHAGCVNDVGNAETCGSTEGALSSRGHGGGNGY